MKDKIYRAVPIVEWMKKNEDGPDKLVPVIKNGYFTQESFWGAESWKNNKGKFRSPKGITHVLEAVSLPGEDESNAELNKLAVKLEWDFMKPNESALVWRKCYEWMCNAIIGK